MPVKNFADAPQCSCPDCGVTKWVTYSTGAECNGCGRKDVGPVKFNTRYRTHYYSYKELPNGHNY
jgi:hypothetical protein